MDLYVLGGYNGSSFDVEECRRKYRFNGVSKQWGAMGEMPVPRFHHAAVVHGDHIYMIGGASMVLSSSEETGHVLSPTASNHQYHPRTRTWVELPEMKTCRVYHSAAAGFGNIYVFGGLNEEQTVLDTVEIYDIELRKWRVGPSLRYPLMGSTATLSGGSVYVVGGMTTPSLVHGARHDRYNVINRAHILDVYSNEWTALPSLPVPLVHHAAVCMHGEIVIIGGSTVGKPKKNEVFKPHLISRRDIFSFNEEGKKWELAGKLSELRSGCGAAVSGTLYSKE
ncbi:putative Beta-scruin [Hypsibius exemplaris]|uniref:Beta-scruin n=1 Tax=Hypsibius exemplaris TaxID=2072580 RepID=A0A1W0WEJ0_HYPEX|nr:putative Beta-scruin [Hypsibius exemplaris]